MGVTNIIEKFRKSGITSATPQNLLLNACVLYKDLKWDSENKHWSGILLGATSGGTKLTIKSEYKDIEVDGATVAVRGLKQKMGESASIETNLLELTPDIIKMSIVGTNAVSDNENFDLYTTKALLDDTDFIDNIAAIGTLSNGQEIIVIMENMICTSGFELDTKNKENTVLKCTFECSAGFDDSHDTLPVYIYYPKKTTEDTTVIYTQTDLAAMTVVQIETLAEGLGYTLTGNTKDEKIASFLEQQNGGE